MSYYPPVVDDQEIIDGRLLREGIADEFLYGERGRHCREAAVHNISGAFDLDKGSPERIRDQVAAPRQFLRINALPAKHLSHPVTDATVMVMGRITL